MKLRKLFVILLALLMIFSFAGCSGGGSGSDDLAGGGGNDGNGGDNGGGTETAPELPATTLKDACYANMFEGCSSLNWIRVHFVDNSPYFST